MKLGTGGHEDNDLQIKVQTKLQTARGADRKMGQTDMDTDKQTDI